MFFLTTLQDIIPMAPDAFGLDALEHLKRTIQNKYIDRIIPSVGLAIAFYDFVKVHDAVIPPSEGGAMFRVDFRFVVFRPFVNEIIEGEIIASDLTGLKISLTFFNDIRIPSNLLKEPKEFDESSSLWKWNYEGHPLYYTIKGRVRFKVEDVSFHNKSDKEGQTGSIPKTSQVGVALGVSPMSILGTVQEPGLGIVDWWT
eukprot:GHVN01045610.1.p1 GENE.GHVN01045610.1~~GHVN01045610.1.p1  ORF type:complete len:200 (+),score=18.45 GHVN01045610.1:298-897(+)